MKVKILPLTVRGQNADNAAGAKQNKMRTEKLRGIGCWLAIRRLVTFVSASLIVAGMAWADCALTVGGATDAPFSTTKFLFPNWLRTPTAAFEIYECPDADCGCASGPITAITIQNFGTASGGPTGDITGMYFWILCKSTTSGLRTMSYVGNWGGIPTWTWVGSIPFASDPCSVNECGCAVSLFCYTDIGPCPTDGATVRLGPGFNSGLNPLWPGGIYDSCNCAAWSDVKDNYPKVIKYIVKQGNREVAAPGDSVNYTLFYGRPGTGVITTEWVLDSQPAYTHLVPGSANPLPQPGWDPNPGPPTKLMWKFSPVGSTTGGPTSRIDFALSVDWGNGDTFEPGSGNVAAPEGYFLLNQAHLSWSPDLGCPSGMSSNAPSTSVRRFLWWMVGDNDILFASRIGASDDEMIYSIFVSNTSDTKTWWNVSIWDSVPSQVNPWQVDCGFDDPCSGWTMTPSGCASGAPGRLQSASNTLLTWQLDMPPRFTITLRWKARVVGSVNPGQTALNRVSILELGHSRIIDGTGHSGTARVFNHEAQIVLRTSYISYVGWAGAASNYFSGCSQVYYISFYPLNRATEFALYRKWCCSNAPCDTGCAVFAQDGGVSPTIDVMAGTCTGGPGTSWETGCKSERAPARFVPSQWRNAEPAYPFNFLHKLVSNAPGIWELSTCFDGGGDDDASTYVGTTSMSYCGYIGYSYVQVIANCVPTTELLYMANTDENTITSTIVFSWDPLTLSWEYLDSTDIFNESQWAYVPVENNHYRILSSSGRLIIHKCSPYADGTGNKYHDFSCFAPNRENGNLVSESSPSSFYLWSGHLPALNQNIPTVALVGNVGAAPANYDVYVYRPYDITLSNSCPSVTMNLVGNAGYWSKVASGSASVGIAPGPLDAGNPHVYGDYYDFSGFLSMFSLYKVKLLSGGPIQVLSGRGLFDQYHGGSMLHAAVNDAGKKGTQTGREFWVQVADADRETCGGNDWSIQTINLFAPKGGMAINCTANDGMNATYTTNGVDQCISFKAITIPTRGAQVKRNFHLQVTTGTGDVIAQTIACEIAQKFFTAPFMQKGVFYNIIAPPVVYSGQQFWITVVVMDTVGGTKTDYNGTTSFTSTDPTAKLEGYAMDTYNFTWDGCGIYCGVKVFINVVFNGKGMQTIIASDTVDGSIIGVATVLVVGADIKVEKRRKLTVAASGDTVQFQICWSNNSSATGFSFAITDAVPLGTTYVPELASNMLCGTSAPVPGVTVWYSTATTTTPPGTFTSIPGTGSPLGNTRWLRWTIRDAYVNSSGCVCFKVSVN